MDSSIPVNEVVVSDLEEVFEEINVKVIRPTGFTIFLDKTMMIEKA